MTITSFFILFFPHINSAKSITLPFNKILSTIQQIKQTVINVNLAIFNFHFHIKHSQIHMPFYWLPQCTCVKKNKQRNNNNKKLFYDLRKKMNIMFIFILLFLMKHHLLEQLIVMEYKLCISDGGSVFSRYLSI